MSRVWLLFVLVCPLMAELRFRAQEIQKDFGVVYAVTTADINGDGKPDVVAINPTQVVWYENPTWDKHIILDGVSKKDNVALAVHDVDGDGQADVALGADWQPTNTTGGGSLQWIGRKNGTWTHTPLGEEPTLHRMRFGDVDGDGKKELIVMPLHGRGNERKPDWEGAGARVLVFKVPADPYAGNWPMEVADESLHIVHNLIAVDFDGDKRDEIVVAAREGLFVIEKENGKWGKRQIGDGSPGEVKLGKLNGLQRAFATVEPWHGNGLVIYEEPMPKLNPQGAPPARGARPWDGTKWPRQFIEERLAQAHALGWGDLDGDGGDELVVGWRDKNFGVAVYSRGRDGKWARTLLVDDGGMATEDLAVEDLDGDGRPEIIAVGRKTANVKIYWNESVSPWKRHEISSGFANHTAIGGDFTGDGKVDVIVNDQTNLRTVLYSAPDWKPTVLQQGNWAIHSAAMDVDGDGDLDWIGAQYSPGLIFWLERPKNPLTEKWAMHVIDDVVNGVHGLWLGDVDGDGKLDVIGNSGQPKGVYGDSIAWFKAPKNPRAKWRRTVFADSDAPGLSHYMGFGDVNGDGRGDIAAGAKMGPEGNWFAWWEAPQDRFKNRWTKHVIADKQEGATNIAIVDVNRDGKMDFLATRGHGVGVVWYEGPAWKAHEIDSTLAGPHDLAVGDIDGDGSVDAVTCAKDSMVCAWFENDGKGNFVTRVIHVDQAAYDIRLVDMDGDGDLDVLVAGQNSNNVVWYENRLKRR